VAVTASNRFAGGRKPQGLTLIDAAAALAGKPAVLASVPTGAFPRELAVLPDGRTLLVTNFDSRTVEMVGGLPRG
jgi:DNA-binding beta-propeller fold protein YncE